MRPAIIIMLVALSPMAVTQPMRGEASFARGLERARELLGAGLHKEAARKLSSVLQRHHQRAYVYQRREAVSPSPDSYGNVAIWNVRLAERRRVVGPQEPT